MSHAVFPIALCAACRKFVLTHVQLDAAGAEVRCCVHCDCPVMSQIEWLSAAELDANGYYVGVPPQARSGGCASGCGSCSTRR